MRENSSLATTIIDCSLKRRLGKENAEAKVNISQLAKNSEMHLSTLWCYLNGKRKWPADHFLRLLAEIGDAKIVDECLIIDISKVPKSALNKTFCQRAKKSWVKKGV